MRVWRLFRRRQQATGPAAESLQGAVLLDNTTVFGARRALDWEPSLPRTLPPGVDLRSLMDVIEAIVLVNDLMVDASSRSFSAFPALQEVSDLSSSFYRDTVVAESLSDGL
ncbi:hypothetical protein AB0M20_14240, partial [Actinoplanes sp. NPDC051633]|uniref:hypothetical protein n=1 Tax=Actinoplanes sp. NPDC051633 TaxID=3155670 RepID=UPI0034323514